VCVCVCRYRNLEDTPGACLELSKDGRLAAVGTSEGSAMVGAAALLMCVCVCICFQCVCVCVCIHCVCA